MTVTLCVFCHRAVSSNDEGTWKEVYGWVGGPKKDSMRGRADTGRYAHDHCVQKVLQEKQAPDQASLFESASDDTPASREEEVPEV